jgi:WD40 repeat protein
MRVAFDGHQSSVVHLAWINDGKAIVSTGQWDSICWEAKTGKRLSGMSLGGRLIENADAIDELTAASPDGQTIVSLPGGFLNQGEVRLFDFKTGQPKATLRGHGGGVSAAAFTADSRTLATLSQDRKLRLWDVQAAKILQTFDGLNVEHSMRGLAWAPDGAAIAAGGWDVRVWRLETVGPQ